MSPAVAEARDFDLTLPDGRRLRVHEAGDPRGKLVVYHHGTPMSGLLAGAWSIDAYERGIRLVGFDRPGYGGSDRHRGRAISDVAKDVAHLADALGVDRFYTWGMSGGGPHALACAALPGERVFAAASVAGIAPYDADGLDFLHGMGQDNLDEFGAATQSETALRAYLAAQRSELMSASAEGLREALASLLPDVDRVALTGDVAEFLWAAMVEGLGGGYEGWLDDDLAFVSPWGFELSSIGVPVLLVQGQQDLMVPFPHGRWLAGQVGVSTAQLLPDEGHLSLLARVGDVHAWLLDHG
ncbi:MAG: alpha/beta hydrolase [Nocardioidaceae bacterium]|nr:alpha/beta hydrolase [Nocardioidaceae bacterium]